MSKRAIRVGMWSSLLTAACTAPGWGAFDNPPASTPRPDSPSPAGPARPGASDSAPVVSGSPFRPQVPGENPALPATQPSAPAPTLPDPNSPAALPLPLPDLGNDIESPILPSIRTYVNLPLQVRAQMLEGPQVTPIYDTALFGKIASVGPAPDHPPWFPQFTPDLTRRFQHQCNRAWRQFVSEPMPGYTPPLAQGGAPGQRNPTSNGFWEPFANPGYRTDGEPSFTWRDWLTRKETPGITLR